MVKFSTVAMTSDTEADELLINNIMKMDKRTKRFIWGTYLVYLLYIWSLPWLSWFFNQYLGYDKELCLTPAEEIVCGDGRDYLELAKAAGRIRDGQYYGCGCCQGVFGDVLCAAKSKHEIKHGIPIGYTVSQLISTAPATGGMALVSIGPILTMWFYGVVNPEMRKQVTRIVKARDAEHSTVENIIWYSVVAFQVSYCLFLFCTYCIFPTLHQITTALFMVCFVVYGVTIAYTIGSDSKAAHIIRTVSILGFASFAIGFCIEGLCPACEWRGIRIGQYAFWFGEALGLSFAFSAPTILASLQGTSLILE